MLNIGEVERPAISKVGAGDTGELMAKNPFYSLLGDCYTIVVREKNGSYTDARFRHYFDDGLSASIPDMLNKATPILLLIVRRDRLY